MHLHRNVVVRPENDQLHRDIRNAHVGEYLRILEVDFACHCSSRWAGATMNMTSLAGATGHMTSSRCMAPMERTRFDVAAFILDDDWKGARVYNRRGDRERRGGGGSGGKSKSLVWCSARRCSPGRLSATRPCVFIVDFLGDSQAAHGNSRRCDKNSNQHVIKIQHTYWNTGGIVIIQCHGYRVSYRSAVVAFISRIMTLSLALRRSLSSY